MIGIEVRYVGRVPVVRPRGDIDTASASLLHEEVSRRLSPDTDELIVDLSATRYLDSAGIDVIFRLHERLRQRRAELRVVVPPASPLRRLLAIVALPTAVAVHTTVQDALTSIEREDGDVPATRAVGDT